MTPEISVVIPAYNAGKYIAECIASVLEQQCLNIEVIVVDDCSTDNTRDVVAQFDASIVKYLCLDNNFGGPSKPRNTGIKQAKGKYLVMLDADDILVNNSISKRVEILKNNNAIAFVFCDGLRFSEIGGDYTNSFLSQHSHFQTLIKESEQKQMVVLDSQRTYRTLAKGDFILPSGMVVRKSTYDHVGIYDESVTNGQDLDMSLRIISQFPIVYLGMLGFKQRVHEDSISTKGHKLIENKIFLLKKNLNRSNDKLANIEFNRKISENFASLGYHYRSLCNLSQAKHYYYESLKFKFSAVALRGIILSMLNEKFYKKLYTLFKSINVAKS